MAFEEASSSFVASSLLLCAIDRCNTTTPSAAQPALTRWSQVDDEREPDYDPKKFPADGVDYDAPLSRVSR